MSDLVELFAENAQQNGMVVHRGRPPAIDLAVESEAIYGLADPGSIVFAASPSQPRAESLLAEVHIG
ncbi:MAG: hypothetical protein ACE5EV_08245, partial [Gaiellales bacterium]